MPRPWRSRRSPRRRWVRAVSPSTGRASSRSPSPAAADIAALDPATMKWQVYPLPVLAPTKSRRALFSGGRSGHPRRLGHREPRPERCPLHPRASGDRDLSHADARHLDAPTSPSPRTAGVWHVPARCRPSISRAATRWSCASTRATTTDAAHGDTRGTTMASRPRQSGYLLAAAALMALALPAFGQPSRFPRRPAGPLRRRRCSCRREGLGLCGVCHRIGPRRHERNRPGAQRRRRPQGWLVSRFHYSDANKNSGITWDEATLTQYLQTPRSSPRHEDVLGLTMTTTSRTSSPTSSSSTPRATRPRSKRRPCPLRNPTAGLAPGLCLWNVEDMQRHLRLDLVDVVGRSLLGRQEGSRGGPCLQYCPYAGPGPREARVSGDCGKDRPEAIDEAVDLRPLDDQRRGYGYDVAAHSHQHARLEAPARTRRMRGPRCAWHWGDLDGAHQAACCGCRRPAECPSMSAALPRSTLERAPRVRRPSPLRRCPALPRPAAQSPPDGRSRCSHGTARCRVRSRS